MIPTPFVAARHFPLTGGIGPIGPFHIVEATLAAARLSALRPCQKGGCRARRPRRANIGGGKPLPYRNWWMVR